MRNSDYSVRKCTCSDEAHLIPILHKLEIYNSVISYQCDTCSKEIKITPMGSTGMLITVGIIAIGILAYLQLSGSGQPGLLNYAIVAFTIICLAAITVPQLLTHQRYPILHAENTHELQINNEFSKHILAKPISLIERLGFLFGLLAPVLFIACVLGGAALIGYINFTFFN